jgi:hypothetical protein
MSDFVPAEIHDFVPARARETIVYHLVIETPVLGRIPPMTWRTIEEYNHLDDLIRDAADYESGEYRGQVVGSFTLTYRGGRLVASAPIADLNDQVHAELRIRRGEFF